MFSAGEGVKRWRFLTRRKQVDSHRPRVDGHTRLPQALSVYQLIAIGTILMSQSPIFFILQITFLDYVHPHHLSLLGFLSLNFQSFSNHKSILLSNKDSLNSGIVCRSWINGWSRSLCSCWNRGSRTLGTSFDYFISHSWTSCCSFGFLLCRVS